MDTWKVTWESGSSDPLSAFPETADVPSSGEPVCLWTAGFIANRAELARGLDLPPGPADASLLLALYARHGRKLASMVYGPFAWALYDPSERCLTAARDRMGSFGLYYARSGPRLHLSNSISSLLLGFGVRPRWNRTSLVAHLNALPPLPGATFYDGIQSVEPGMIVTLSDRGVETTRYWQIELLPTLCLRSDQEYADAFRERLYSIVSEYVPETVSGITLSGGLDSTSVAAALCAAAPAAKVHAFSWTSPELPEADEVTLSLAAARRLSLPVTLIRSDLHWTLSAAEGLHTPVESPFLLHYRELWDATLCEMRRHDIRVVFTGVPGDNLFGSNVFAYGDLLLTGHWAQMAREFRAHVPRSPLHPTPWRAVKLFLLGPLLQAYLPRLLKPAPGAPWLGDEPRALFQHTFGSSSPNRRVLPGRKQRLEALRQPLLPHIVEQKNRDGAAHGIEFRHPLLDHRMVEFAASLPTMQTFRGGQRKIIMRNAMRGILPDAILDARGKVEPTRIAERGLREREQAKVWSYIRGMRLGELRMVDEARLQAHYREYVAGRTDNTLFWYAMTLEDWLRRYF